MRLLYKCKKYSWGSFINENIEKIEAYYLEVKKEELTDELKELLRYQNNQMEYQLNKFDKLYIIIDEYKKIAFYVPNRYGPYWPASGHWDMSDNFKSMFGIKISNIDELVNIKENLLKYSIDYINRDHGVFGNLNEFCFGKYGAEYFNSAIVESIIYNYFLSQNQIPIVPKEEMNYSFIVNDKRILIKTNASKIDNNYLWSTNSCWHKNIEFNKNEWDELYFVQVKWDGNRYNLSEKYKIPYKKIHENNELLNEIYKNTKWYIPIDIDIESNWIKEYRI